MEPKVATGNLKLIKLLADKITYVKMKDVSEAMDAAMLDFTNSGFKASYIWGGGHSREGSLAYYYAILELNKQLKSIEPA